MTYSMCLWIEQKRWQISNFSAFKWFSWSVKQSISFRHIFIVQEIGSLYFPLHQEYFEIHLLEDVMASYEGILGASSSELRSSAWEVTGISAFEASNIGSFLFLTAQCIDCKQMSEHITRLSKLNRLHSVLKNTK